MRPFQGFWAMVEKGHLFQGNKGKILREQGNKDKIWGTWNKRYFLFLGNRGTRQFISGEQGNRYTPSPWEGLIN